MFNRQIRSALHFVKTNLKQTVQGKQLDSESQSHRFKPMWQYIDQEEVLIRNFGQGPRWMRGKISGKRGPVTYDVEVGE